MYRFNVFIDALPFYLVSYKFMRSDKGGNVHPISLTTTLTVHSVVLSSTVHAADKYTQNTSDIQSNQFTDLPARRQRSKGRSPPNVFEQLPVHQVSYSNTPSNHVHLASSRELAAQHHASITSYFRGMVRQCRGQLPRASLRFEDVQYPVACVTLRHCE